MADRERLEIEINADGMVAGRRVAVRELDEVGKATKRTGGDLSRFDQLLDGAGARMAKFGRALTLVSLPILALGGATTKLASDFESSFAGIRKTVNATEPEFARLSKGMRDLSKQVPVSVNDLNRIGEAAGQLGIEKANILAFTETIAALGVTTDLSTDQAATSLARLANITGLPQSKFDRLGSTIVDLGNNLATTESQIVDFGLRIAGAGDIAGLTEAQILGIGAAMSSVGVEAEAGGTSVQKVLLGIVQAVANGGDELRIFAATAGLSVGEFSRLFREDAASAFAAFVEGLGRQGDQAFKTLEALELTDQRLIRSFLSLANAGDLLSRAMGIGSQAFEQNTALAKEAEQRYKTFESRLTTFWNRVKDVGITLGTALLPALTSALDAAQPLIDWAADAAQAFADLPRPIQTVTIALGALAIAGGPPLIALGNLIQSLVLLKTTSPMAAAALTQVGVAARALAGPLGIALAAVTALNLAVTSISDNLDRETASIVDDAQRIGAAFEALRNAQEQIRSDGGAILNADQYAAIEGQLERLRAKHAETLDEISRLQSQLESGGFNSAQADLAQQSLDRLGNTAAQQAREIDKWQKALDLSTAATEKLADATAGSGSGGVPSAAGATDEFRDSVASLMDSLDPALAATRDYAAGSLLLAEALRQDVIDGETWTQMMDKLLQRYREVVPLAESYLQLKAASVTIAGSTEGDLGILGPTKETAADRAGTTTAAEFFKRIKDATLDASDIMGQAAKNFVENIQRSFGEAIYQFARHGEVSFTAMWDTFRDLGLRVISELAAKMATLKLTNAITTPSGGINLAGLKSLFGGGGAGGAGISWGAVAGFAAVAAVAVFSKWQKDQDRKKQFDTTSSVRFNADSNRLLTSSWGHLAEGTGSKISSGIAGLLAVLQESTGRFITGMDDIVVKIRHDKKAFQIGNQVFRTMEEAILEGAKQAFLSADLTGELNPVIRDFVSGFRGSADELAEGIGLIQSEIDAGSGLSDLALEIRGLAADARQTADEMARLGVSRADSQEIAGFSFIERFKELTRSLYGEQLSPEAQLEQQQKAGEIAQAELELMRAQLQARKAYLEGQLAMGQQEAQILQFKLDAEGKGVNIRGRIAEAEIGVLNDYLGARGQFAQKQAQAFQAELAAINKVLEALAGLDIDIGKIKIPSLGKSFGGHVSKFGGLVDRFNRGVANFVDAILGARQDTATSPLTDRERLQSSFDQYQQLLAGARSGNVTALEQLPQAYRDLLALAKDFSGGATGLGFLGLGDSFREFFDRLEGGALDFASAGRPKKLFEANLVVPERFYAGQERQTKELNERRKEAHAQTVKVADAVDQLGSRLEESLERLVSETRANRKALTLYDSKRTAEAA